MRKKLSDEQLESQLSALLLPVGSYYMNPPDGGDVPLIEQVRRMIEDLREQLAKCENTRSVAEPIPNIAIEVSNGVTVGVFPEGNLVNPHYAHGWNDNNSYRATMLSATKPAQAEDVPDVNNIAEAIEYIESIVFHIDETEHHGMHIKHFMEQALLWLRGEPGRAAMLAKQGPAIPDDFLFISRNINTQDNRITSDPIFCVFQKKEIVVDGDYDFDRFAWISDGIDADETKSNRLDSLYQGGRDTGDWQRIAVKEIDDFVTACFTEQGCKNYLTVKGHNLRMPFIYVISAYRNNEYQAVRNCLSSLANGDKGAK